MITTLGIPFTDFQEQAKNLPILVNFESKCFLIDHKYVLPFLRSSPQIKDLFLNSIQPLNLIKSKYKSRPNQYTILISIFLNSISHYKIANVNHPMISLASDYLPIHEYIQDEAEQQNFIKDSKINPATGIAMITMHNCLLSEFIHFVSEGKTFLLTLISYYFSKLHIYIKKSEYQE
ncbi:unnamed protein product (macronuclear) [Paramecium tetraurelia]|uniref:Uncharacterized protein n=1 Tax=Paramecium tetraurelia TaxID=5888 RepID=A0E4N1_PARTE|nr:uncharacterized protein GSPATT00023423001 [Paramecium tetraurelia]CAK90248.1 unnamed protein product [Paramecium tetraurelia]|eukprot:XP_001457645.1 hypothetical protein (macronuclear) [Paramecium tetraurelia strain d4-2]